MPSFSSSSTVFDNLPIGLYRTLPNGQFVAANDALAQIVGAAAPCELIGTSAADVYSRDDRRSFTELLEREGVGILETEVYRRDGGRCWVRISARAVRDEFGRVCCYEGAVQDITEVRALEEALRASEGQYRALFEGGPPTMAFDVETLRFVAANPAAVAAYGYSRDELLTMTPVDIRPPEDRPKFLEAVRIISATEPADGVPRPRGVWHHRRKDGSVFPAEITSGHIRFGNRNVLLFVAVDVTERTHAEAEREDLVRALLASRKRFEAVSLQLARAQERERRTIALELHDQIGQMLTGLKLILEATDEEGRLGREEVDEVKTLVDRLMQRVNGMTLDLRPPVLDRLGLLPALLGLVQRFMLETRIDVEFVHSGINRRFSSELETAAFRTVQEALTNVARHARVDRVAVRVYNVAGKLSVEIEDEGAGFDADTALEQESPGLSGMRERAAGVGGSVMIDSAPGMGTVVLAELPVDADRETAAS